ncbi:MAG: hypothetical protein ACP5U1_16705 [Desulfomonilaceae bacterium]
MGKLWTSCLTLILLLGVFVFDSNSQNLIVDQQRQQREIDRLKSDVEELKRTVQSMRREILKKSIAADKDMKAVPSAPTPPPPKTLSAAEQEKAKAQICQQIGTFFDQIDDALKMSDPSRTGRAMRKAVAQLNSELRSYGQSQKIRELQSLAEALAWDTYVAVENRNSVAGNADFLNYIKGYKERYEKRCLKH